MKRKKYSKKQTIKILNEAEVDVAVEYLNCQHGFSKNTFYKWKAKNGDLNVSQLNPLKS